MVFKNYRCPNGLPPEECGHFPQIINNIATYFIRKSVIKTLLQNKEISEPINSQHQYSHNSKTRNHNRTRV